MIRDKKKALSNNLEKQHPLRNEIKELEIVLVQR
jgi:hypothetical protein